MSSGKSLRVPKAKTIRIKSAEGTMLSLASRPVRVAMVLPELGLRGSVRRSLNLTRELIRRGNHVALVSPGGALAREFKELEAEHIAWQLGASGKRAALFSLAVPTGQLAAFRPEIVHVNSLRWFTPWKAFARKLRVPVIATVQSSTEAATIVPRMWTMLSRVVAVSQDVREALVNTALLDRDRVAVIPSGLPALPEDEISARLNRSVPAIPVIACIGPLTNYQGILTLLEAASRFKMQGRQARFVILGAGPEAAAIRQWINHHAMTDSIILVEELYNYAHLYDSPDIVVSVDDSLDTAYFAAEAMGMGIPVAVSAIGSHLELVQDEVSGVLFPPNDAEALASRIAWLLDDNRRRMVVARAGWKRVRDCFGIATMAENIESLYSSCIKLPRM